MKKSVLLIGFSMLLMTGFSKEILLECGIATGKGYNGWYIDPVNNLSDLIFTDETVAFYTEQKGDFTFLMTKKINLFSSYSLLNLEFDFTPIENCKINYVDVYVSEDNKNWRSIQNSNRLYKTTISENVEKISFLRLAVNVSFFGVGSFEATYFKLTGENTLVADQNFSEIFVQDDFFIFSFNKSVSIETKDDAIYEIVIINMAGQIVYTEKTTGSSRVETNFPEGIYIVSIVKDGKIYSTKKLVL